MKSQALNFLFRAIVEVAVAALVITSAALSRAGAEFRPCVSGSGSEDAAVCGVAGASSRSTSITAEPSSRGVS